MATTFTGGTLAMLGLAACGSQPTASNSAPAPVGTPTTPIGQPSAPVSQPFQPADDSKPAKPGATKPAAADRAAKTTTAKATLGPYGFGKLRLGMTVAQAKATGQLGAQKIADGCDGYDLAGYPTPANSVGVYFSRQHGLVAIFASGAIATPEGIRLGTKINHVQALFPASETGTNGIIVDVPGHKAAYYTIGATADAKRVQELGLAADHQNCFG